MRRRNSFCLPNFTKGRIHSFFDRDFLINNQKLNKGLSAAFDSFYN